MGRLRPTRLPAAPVRAHQKRYRSPYALVALLAFLVSAFVVVSMPATAGAQSKCGKRVLDDWFDNGRIDKLYKLNCYEEAIDAIPKDLDPYVDARDVINRALQGALNNRLARGGCDPTPDKDDSDLCRGIPLDGSGPNEVPEGDDPVAAPDVDATGASSVPVPLLVLGGMSIALLAAGGLGYLSRRRLNGDDGDPPDAFPH